MSSVDDGGSDRGRCVNDDLIDAIEEMIEAGNASGAIEACDHGLHRFQAHWHLYALRGVARSKVEDYAGAISDLSDALKLVGGKGINIRFFRARAYSQALMYDKAIDEYSSILELDFAPDALFNRGVVYRKSGRYQDAIHDFKKLLERGNTSFDVYYILGLCCLAAGDWPMARDAFLDALKIDPHHSECYYNLGIAFEELDNIDRAIEVYSRAIEYDDEFFDAHYNKGLLHKAIGEHGNFAKEMRYVVEKSNSDELVRLAKGLLQE